MKITFAVVLFTFDNRSWPVTLKVYKTVKIEQNEIE